MEDSVSTGPERELQRVRDVTANYFFWQGLRWVLLGLLIVIFALRHTPWWPLDGNWNEVVLSAAVVAVIIVSPLIGRYYRRTYGEVRDAPEAHRRREMVKWFFVYPAMFGSLGIDLTYKPVFFATGPVWAAGILAYWWSTGRGRRHYLLAALSMGALGFVQLYGLVEPGKQMLSFFSLVLGAIYIFGGLLDHLELRQLLRPIKEGQDEAPI
jgi:hypothetical protein